MNHIMKICFINWCHILWCSFLKFSHIILKINAILERRKYKRGSCTSACRIRVETWDHGPVRFSCNPSFSACFFSRNSVFLSQQISRNSVSACFSAKRTRPWIGYLDPCLFFPPKIMGQEGLLGFLANAFIWDRGRGKTGNHFSKVNKDHAFPSAQWQIRNQII